MPIISYPWGQDGFLGAVSFISQAFRQIYLLHIPILRVEPGEECRSSDDVYRMFTQVTCGRVTLLRLANSPLSKRPRDSTSVTTHC